MKTNHQAETLNKSSLIANSKVLKSIRVNFAVKFYLIILMFTYGQQEIFAQCIPPVITLNVTNASCSSCCDGAVVPTVSLFPPYLINWSTGETTLDIHNLCAGTYTITVGYSNCTSSATVYVGIDSSASNPYLLTGQVYYDINTNGALDAGEPGMNNISVTLQEPTISLMTWNNGTFMHYVSAGEYQLSLNTPAGWHLTSNTSTYNESISTSSVSGLNFGIHPDSVSPPHVYTSIHSGAPLCNTITTFFVDYDYQGIIPASGLIEYTFDTLMTYQSATPLPSSVSGNVLRWNYSNLLMYQCQTITINFLLPGAGNTIVNAASFIAVDVSGNTIDSSGYVYPRVVSCSYDPNDKSVNPPGETAKHYTPMNSSLDYTIRFQNTGNAPATRVEIVDTLSNHLDLNSLRIIGTSHPMTLIIENRTLHFVFDNILLPDSNENEPASHGYVFYTIKPIGNLPEFTAVKNTAHIFFDLNAPVVTNTTLNTLSNFPVSAMCSSGNSSTQKIKVCHGKKTLCVDVNAVNSHLAHGDYIGSCTSNREENTTEETDNSVTELKVFPNPSSGDLTLSFIAESNSEVVIELFNSLGQKIYFSQESAYSGNFSKKLSLSEYPDGLYYLRILVNGRNYSLPVMKKL